MELRILLRIECDSTYHKYPECCYKCKRSVPPKKIIIPSMSLVRASVKLDGSMIVAYMRHGVLYTNTKERSDSQ